MSPQSPYQILGEEGIRQLAYAFYDVMDELPQAQSIRNMHAENMDEIKQKLTDYLTGWMGGPPLYMEKHGSICLTDPHKPFAIGPAERDQWVLCFEKALERIGASDELKQMLKGPVQGIAAAVQNRETSD